MQLLIIYYNYYIAIFGYIWHSQFLVGWSTASSRLLSWRLRLVTAPVTLARASFSSSPWRCMNFWCRTRDNQKQLSHCGRYQCSSCSSAPQCFVPAIQVPLWVSHHLQVQGLLALPRHPAQQRDPQVVVEAQSTPEAENAYWRMLSLGRC